MKVTRLSDVSALCLQTDSTLNDGSVGVASLKQMNVIQCKDLIKQNLYQILEDGMP